MTTEARRWTRCLDLTRPEEIAAFERGFYESFAHATHNRLVRWLWQWDDDARRLRTRIPYAEQRIWVLGAAADTITGAIAVNLAMHTLQAAAYGFAVPAGLGGGRVCEFLTLFSVGDLSLTSKHALWNELFDDLRAEGFAHAVATTSPKILPLYRWAGAEVVAEATLEGEVRYFLRFDLSRTAAMRRPRRAASPQAG